MAKAQPDHINRGVAVDVWILSNRKPATRKGKPCSYAMDVHAYLAREMLAHASDAWIDEDRHFTSRRACHDVSTR